VSHSDDVLRTIERVARALDGAGVDWAICGSIASSVHGEPRSTNDIDFVARLRREHVAGLLAALGTGFYADEHAIGEAIDRRSSFNVIDDETMVKADVFVPGPGALGEDQLVRRARVAVTTDLEVPVIGAEDTVLQKLRWFELGGRGSDRQWRDLVAVLRLGEDRLDLDYMRRVAGGAGLLELLEKAVADAVD